METRTKPVDAARVGRTERFSFVRCECADEQVPHYYFADPDGNAITPASICKDCSYVKLAALIEAGIVPEDQRTDIELEILASELVETCRPRAIIFLI